MNAYSQLTSEFSTKTRSLRNAIVSDFAVSHVVRHVILVFISSPLEWMAV